ncbi:MAG: HNH endonuclease [Ktedonobacterales bacterium]
MGKGNKRRRIAARQLSGEYITIADFWRWRAKNYCGICGQEITRYEDASVDHIIPLADGGGETITNTRLAHRICNSTGNHAQKYLLELAEMRARHEAMGRIPNENARRTRFWRRHEPNLCGVCGGLIPHRTDAVLRYRVPLEDGGVDERANMELVHWECDQQNAQQSA